MSAAQNVIELVSRELELRNIGEKARQDMPQSTEDFFTREDREQLYRVKFQSEKILQDLGDIKASAKETARTQTQAMEAHETRLRALEEARYELRSELRTLAADLLEKYEQRLQKGEERLTLIEKTKDKLETQIKTSWWWIGVISVGASAVVNLLLRLFVK